MEVRHGLDSAWLWLYLAAIALIQPLTWELPYAAGVALRSKKKKKKEKKKEGKKKKKERVVKKYFYINVHVIHNN